MTKQFEYRVMREGIVDTKLYRYKMFEDFNQLSIKRLPIKYLDTMKAYSNWETVKIYN